MRADLNFGSFQGLLCVLSEMKEEDELICLREKSDIGSNIITGWQLIKKEPTVYSIFKDTLGVVTSFFQGQPSSSSRLKEVSNISEDVLKELRDFERDINRLESTVKRESKDLGAMVQIKARFEAIRIYMSTGFQGLGILARAEPSRSQNWDGAQRKLTNLLHAIDWIITESDKNIKILRQEKEGLTPQKEKSNLPLINDLFQSGLSVEAIEHTLPKQSEKSVSGESEEDFMFFLSTGESQDVIKNQSQFSSSSSSSSSSSANREFSKLDAFVKEEEEKFMKLNPNATQDEKNRAIGARLQQLLSKEIPPLQTPLVTGTVPPPAPPAPPPAPPAPPPPPPAPGRIPSFPKVDDLTPELKFLRSEEKRLLKEKIDRRSSNSFVLENSYNDLVKDDLLILRGMKEIYEVSKTKETEEKIKNKEKEIKLLINEKLKYLCAKSSEFNKLLDQYTNQELQIIIGMLAFKVNDCKANIMPEYQEKVQQAITFYQGGPDGIASEDFLETKKEIEKSESAWIKFLTSSAGIEIAFLKLLKNRLNGADEPKHVPREYVERSTLKKAKPVQTSDVSFTDIAQMAAERATKRQKVEFVDPMDRKKASEYSSGLPSILDEIRMRGTNQRKTEGTRKSTDVSPLVSFSKSRRREYSDQEIEGFFKKAYDKELVRKVESIIGSTTDKQKKITEQFATDIGSIDEQMGLLGLEDPQRKTLEDEKAEILEKRNRHLSAIDFLTGKPSSFAADHGDEAKTKAWVELEKNSNISSERLDLYKSQHPSGFIEEAGAHPEGKDE